MMPSSTSISSSTTKPTNDHYFHLYSTKKNDLLLVYIIVMSGRLDVIRSSLTPPDNRIIHYRKTHPLDRNEVRDHIYSEKYRRVVDKCFDVMMENRHIFKHGDIEDFDRKTERAAGAKMVTSYHRLRPINPLEFEKDPNEFYFSAHATYCFDPGMSVRTDITLFLYTKTIINFHRPESK